MTSVRVMSTHRKASPDRCQVKEGDLIILELQFGEQSYTMCSELKVIDVNGDQGVASFLRVREVERAKTFEEYDEFQGYEIKFSIYDVQDWRPSDL